MQTILVGLDPNDISRKQLARLHELPGNAKLVTTRDRAAAEAQLDDIEIAAAGFPRELLVRCSQPALVPTTGRGSELADGLSGSH